MSIVEHNLEGILKYEIKVRRRENGPKRLKRNSGGHWKNKDRKWESNF